jgi:hypothetical protein
MLQAVQFPASIANLDTGLADMDRDYFAHVVIVLIVFFFFQKVTLVSLTRRNRDND